MLSLQNFHRELAEEDEAYSTMKSSERKTWSKQLDILQYVMDSPRVTSMLFPRHNNTV